eukprot:gene4799-5426_t
MCYSITLKVSFRQALQSSDHVILNSLLKRNSGLKQLQKLLTEERFNGFTALQQACLRQNVNMVSLLLESGAEIEQRGKHGWTALHAAAFSSREATSIITLLLNSCADVAAKDNHGCLPVDMAANDVIREMLLAKMEARGDHQLVRLHRRLIETNSHLAEHHRVDECPMFARSNSAELTDDAPSEDEDVEIDLDFHEFSRKISRLKCDHMDFIVDKMNTDRRLSTWDSRRKTHSTRDSGIFSDDSDTHSLF